jgi:hypothetical protein
VVYRSILVNLDIDRPFEPITEAAIDLASRSGARLVGLCAAETLAERMEEARAAFLHLAANRIEAEWRGETMAPTEAVVAAARIADLVLMAAEERADPAAIVLRAGRPLLVVGRDRDAIATRKIVIGWKDTREARRAIADALPLLSVASGGSGRTAAAGRSAPPAPCRPHGRSPPAAAAGRRTGRR